MTRRLLMLHDSPQFGGHELMLLKLLPDALGNGSFDEVVAYIPEGNTRLRDGLESLASPILRIESWPFTKKRAEPYLARFRRTYAAAVRRIVEKEKPQSILLVQGRIENLAVPMLALPRDQFIVSYVPMAHRLSDMGRNGSIGDTVRRPLYARPDRFIVPSSSVATQIAAAGGRSTAIVADNFVPPPPRLERDAARHKLKLPDDRKIAVYLGRMDVAQKGLDLLTAAIDRGRDRLGDWTFLFIGQGKGQALISGLTGVDIQIIAWTDQAHLYLAAADLLLMPSRWEGVPLVMLEAMTYGLPILASEIDVFREYLPAENRTDFTAVDLPARMNALHGQTARQHYVEAISHTLAAPTPARSRASFAAALVP